MQKEEGLTGQEIARAARTALQAVCRVLQNEDASPGDIVKASALILEKLYRPPGGEASMEEEVIVE